MKYVQITKVMTIDRAHIQNIVLFLVKVLLNTEIYT